MSKISTITEIEKPYLSITRETLEGVDRFGYDILHRLTVKFLGRVFFAEKFFCTDKVTKNIDDDLWSDIGLEIAKYFQGLYNYEKEMREKDEKTQNQSRR